MKRIKYIPLVFICLYLVLSCPSPSEDTNDESGTGYGSELNPGDIGKFTVSDVTLTSFTLNWLSATDSPVPFEQLEYRVYRSGSDNLSTVEDTLANGTQIGSALTGAAKGVPMSFQITGLSKTDPPSYYTVIVSSQGGDKKIYNTCVYAMPVIKNLSLDFAPFESGTGSAGDFLFTLGSDTGTINKIYDTAFNFNDMKLRPLHVFGDTLLAHDGSPGSRELVFHPDADAYIVSPIDGVVTQIIAQDDYGGTVIDNEVFIAPVEGSGWQISLDHLRNPLQVEVGDSVSAGDNIGKPSLEYEHDDEITDIGMSEFLVLSPDNRCWCPFALFDDTLADTWKSNVSQLMQDWEDYIDTYDSSHNPDHEADQYDASMSAWCSGCTDQYLDP